VEFKNFSGALVDKGGDLFDQVVSGESDGLEKVDFVCSGAVSCNDAITACGGSCVCGDDGNCYRGGLVG